MELSKSRERILSAAETLFSQRGFHCTSVDDIAARAGVAKGTIYYNFGSKGVLFETVLSGGMQKIYAAIRRELATDKPASEQVGSILDLHVRMFLDNPGLLSIFSRELSGGLDAAIRKTARRIRREYLSLVASLLDEGQAGGVIRNLDSMMLASTIFDITLSSCAYAAEASPGLDAAAVSPFVRTLVLEGILLRR